MAKKERNRRSGRKARAQERERVEAAQAAQVQSSSKSSALSKKTSDNKSAAVQKKKVKKPGFFKRIGNYLSDVRSELRLVIWPSKTELKNYSVAVIAMLIVFGVVIWLVDSGIVALLVAYTGLRG